VSLGTTAFSDLTAVPDTLLVAGGLSVDEACADAELLAAISSMAGPARRVASVCSGALVLAAAGLLDGRRATTHWASTSTLAATHPDVCVEEDPIFIRDGKFWTSAGVTTGLDLALAMVAEDLGDEVAREIARWLVMFLRRPGGQSQFSPHLDVRTASSPPLRAVQDWLPGHLDRDLSNANLSRMAGMSERHFTRRFRHEVGVSPAAHVARLRVESAKHLLVDADMTLSDVARHCGFGTVETFHRVFRRSTGTTPDRYRQHFVAPRS
jgi:transcriptional regulator GlxA family with amidase domain